MEKKRVPVTVLTGFLGSGKTTLLNRILTEQHGKRIAVIENEFGEIGIDQALVINADEEIFEMNNGCICCTVRGDLIRILGNLMRRKEKFDHILVETTGMADPGPVAQTFFVDDEIGAQLKLDGIVTMVDAKHVALHIDDSQECKEQIAFGDVVIINKTDLVSEDDLQRVEKRIRSMNAMARIHRAVKGNVPVEVVLDVGGFDLKRALEQKPTFLEPEYPFEWAGLFSFSQSTHSIKLGPGPDASMALGLIPVSSQAQQPLHEAAEKAVRQWSRRVDRVIDQGRLSPNDGRFELDFSNGLRPRSYEVQIPTAGHYVLLTEHRPEEYALKVMGPNTEAIAPLQSTYFGAGHSHDDTVSSVGIELEGDLDQERLNRWMSKVLQENGADIFRMKGILAIAGQKNRFVFQGVHMLFDGEPERPWGTSRRVNQLVFIGRKLDREALTEGFKRCLK